MTLNHVRRGAGEPLLLIHGIGGEWRSWEPVIGRLAGAHWDDPETVIAALLRPLDGAV